MAILPISTKTGDDGTTGLANGRRLEKTAPIFEVLGTIDELSSWIGLVAAQLSATDPIKDALLQTQDVLYQIGAEMAASPKVKVTSVIVKQLEQRSAALQKTFTKNWTTQFVYPGGTVVAAHLDVARTVCRRLERVVWRYHQQTPVSTPIRHYLNRLSDYLFVLRCDRNRTAGFAEKKFTYAQKLAS